MRENGQIRGLGVGFLVFKFCSQNAAYRDKVFEVCYYYFISLKFLYEVCPSRVPSLKKKNKQTNKQTKNSYDIRAAVSHVC